MKSALLSLLLISLSLYADARPKKTGRFCYRSPGDVAKWNGRGKGRSGDRRVYIPEMSFPMRVGQSSGIHAFAKSQVTDGAGKLNYCWRDNYCEHRGWKMPLCPTGTGHQGQDISPQTRRDRHYDAVAFDNGVVTRVSNFTAITVRSRSGVTCRYLHMQNKVGRGTSVRKGQTVVGKISNYMGGKGKTSIHLHFDCKMAIRGVGTVYVPVYSSLVHSYAKAWNLNVSMDARNRLKNSSYEN